MGVILAELNSPTVIFGWMLGIGSVAGGIFMMARHQASYNEALASTTKERIRLFEFRKYRRRMTASSMIAAVGILLIALNMATEPKVFAILLSLILTTVLGVLGLAFIDLFSVGLQEMSKPDDTARKKLVAEILEKREQLAAQKQSDQTENND